MEWSHASGARLFEVSVYRVSPDRWQKEQDEGADDLRYEWEEAAINVPNLDDWAQWLYRNEHGPYEFNQVVAYLQLVRGGPGAIVRGHLSAVDQKQFTRNYRRSKPFRPIGTVFELEFSSAQNSSEIAESVVSEVESLTETVPGFRQRFVDSAPLRAIASDVDWRHIVGLT